MRKLTSFGLFLLAIAFFILPLGVDALYYLLIDLLGNFTMANLYLYIVSAYLAVMGTSLIARNRIPVWGSPLVIILATVSFLAISFILFRGGF